MKRTIIIITAALLCNGVFAQTTVKLPDPRKDAEMTLYQALQQRASVRDFSPRQVTDQTLSDLLWAAVGINRPDGRLTAPTAVNRQEINVYVCRGEGNYRSVAKDNCLVKLSDTDVRKDIAGRQTSVAEAPVILVVVADLAKYGEKNPSTVRYGALDAGFVCQNICLACEALGLSTVPRAQMDVEVLKKALCLTEAQELLLNHPVGYKK